ncbi:MAG: permease [Phycisphaerae bacterium]|nr:permease [Phycisphaerae bacterium]
MPDSLKPSNRRSRWAAFGPGLLFAGAAIGVSHLVQSTRGGAEFGMSAALVVVVSCLIKWPAFRFGPLYASATGNSLLDGYRRQGRGTLVIFGLVTLAVCFTTLAAVTVVTAGLLLNLLPGLKTWVGSLGLPGEGGLDVIWVSGGLLGLVGLGLLTGGYRLLERVMKVVMPVLALCTVVSAGLAISRIAPESWTAMPPVEESSARSLLAAIIGWMPAPIDIAVWSSLWTLAKVRSTGRRSSVRSVVLDFDAGYLSTLVLAVGFVILGASVMHGSGIEFSNQAPEFGRQIVDLYAAQLGEWTRPMIAVAAFLAMLSTTVTVADGFPRATAALVASFFGPVRPTRETRVDGMIPRIMQEVIDRSLTSEPDGENEPAPGAGSESERGSEGGILAYWISFLGIAAGAIWILVKVVPADFKRLIDLVTITSFLVAPVLVFFNHRCVTGPEMPSSLRPNLMWRTWSWICFAATLGLALVYLTLLVVD